MKQVELSRGDRNQVKRVAWIESDESCKEGNHIKLKGEENIYRIDKVYDRNVDKGDIKRTWHVGGL